MIPASMLARALWGDALTHLDRGMTPADVRVLVRRLEVIVDVARKAERAVEVLTAEHAEDVRLADIVAEEQALDGIEVVSLGSDTSLDQLVSVIGSAFGERL